MSDYVVVNVAEQDVCFADKPKNVMVDIGLVMSILNYYSEEPQIIIENGGIPEKYTVRVTVEVKKRRRENWVEQQGLKL